MILILHILDCENRKPTKFQFNFSINFRDINILICKFQNVPCALGFEVKHSKFFLYKFQDTYNNFKYGFHDKYIKPSEVAPW